MLSYMKIWHHSSTLFNPFSALVLFLSAVHVHGALSPDQVLVVANKHSEASVEVAEYWMELRDIPESHLLELKVPDSTVNDAGTISMSDFTKYILSPTEKFIRKKHLESTILALVYSVDLPIRVNHNPALSIMGATLLRGKKADSTTVKNGKWASPYFISPRPQAKDPVPIPLNKRAMPFLTGHPIPSMMLGYIGTNGNTVAEVKSGLKRAVQADGTNPKGGIYFMENKNDPRTTCRAWQFPLAIEELEARGQTAQGGPPPAGAPILGIMAGQPWIKTMNWKENLVPGALCSHLTSCAAIFHNKDQTKATDWIRAGAAATCGTITEPYAIWTKFPTAHIYMHYIKGATTLECYYRSIRCPLQTLLLGDPLCAPFAD